MKSVSSNLGHDKMASEYSKAQKIKDRISKYVSQDNKVKLKYFICNKGHKSFLETKVSSQANLLDKVEKVPREILPNTTRRMTSSKTESRTQIDISKRSKTDSALL